jgi:hypothetical protein
MVLEAAFSLRISLVYREERVRKEELRERERY